MYRGYRDNNTDSCDANKTVSRDCTFLSESVYHQTTCAKLIADNRVSGVICDHINISVVRIT